MPSWPRSGVWVGNTVHEVKDLKGIPMCVLKSEEMYSSVCKEPAEQAWRPVWFLLSIERKPERETLCTLF